MQIDGLPEHLCERTREVSGPAAKCTGEFILYWMHHAVRAHENAALGVAKTAALAGGLPLLVYQGLGGHHRFNSDRHHMFIMEGAREVQSELARQGLRHVFHLSRSASEPSPLTALARRATLVVTEEFPAPPFPRWMRLLARHIEVPLWAVDSACVVPVGVAGRKFERAYAFRRHTQCERDRRVSRAWPEVGASPACF